MSDIEVTPRFKIAPIIAPRHLNLVRFCGCVVPGCRYHMPMRLPMALKLGTQALLARMAEPGWLSDEVIAHHVRRANNSGTAIKPGDNFAAGFCQMPHHYAIHQDGEITCARRWGIDFMEQTERLAAAGRTLGFLP